VIAIIWAALHRTDGLACYRSAEVQIEPSPINPSSTAMDHTAQNQGSPANTGRSLSREIVIVWLYTMASKDWLWRKGFVQIVST
jgi:hypothetical protein